MIHGILVKRVGRLTLGLTLLLVAVVGGWILSSGLHAAQWALAAIATAPLWMCVPALRAGRRRICALMTLLIVPYLVWALTEAVANPAARAWAAATLFVAFALFVCLIAFLRVSREPPSLPGRRAP